MFFLFFNSNNDDLNNTDPETLLNSNNIIQQFNETLDQLKLICLEIEQVVERTSNKKINKLIELKELIYSFLVNCLKRIKESYACFHPNLNVFNRFKAHYRQIKEFYLYFEGRLKIVLNIKDFSGQQQEIIMNGQCDSEMSEVVAKMGYFREVCGQIEELVESEEVFIYHSEISVCNINR